MRVCDSCIEAAIEDGADEDIAKEICVSFGAGMSDHLCDWREGNQTECCACACNNRRTARLAS